MNNVFMRLLLPLLAAMFAFPGLLGAATLYYDDRAGTGDSHWTTLGNWWLDSSHANSSPSLPGDGDSVYIDGNGVYAYLLNAIALLWIHVGEFSGGSGIELHGISGDAIFHGTSFNQGDIIGDAIFKNFSYNGSNGKVTGSAALSGKAYNEGVIGGDAVFVGSSYNGSGGKGGGNGSFSDSTYNEGTIAGNAVFLGDAYNGSGGSVGGDAAFTNSTYNEGAVGGGATFEQTAYNGSSGKVGENAAFSDSTYNEGYVGGRATFVDAAYNGSGGRIEGKSFGNKSVVEGTLAVSIMDPRSVAVSDPIVKTSRTSRPHSQRSSRRIVASLENTYILASKSPIMANISLGEIQRFIEKYKSLLQ